MNQQDRLPPHSTDAEQGILGCCLTSADCIDDCQLRLKAGAGAFYDLRHQTIYAELVAMRRDGVAVDVITMQQRLKDKGLLEQVGGITYLAALPDMVSSAVNLPTYCEMVLEKHALRKVLAACTEATAAIYDSTGDASSLLGQLQNTFQGLGQDDSRTLDSKACTQRMIDDVERHYNLGGKRSGLVTGLIGLDNLTDGLQFAEQTVIAARPSMGKTAIALSIVERVCIADKQPTAFVTLEMSPGALSRRLLSSWARIPMGSIRAGKFTEGEFQRFNAFGVLLRNSPLFMVDAVAGMDCNQVAAAVRRLCRKHSIKLVVIDYLQKIKGATRQEKRTYEVGEVSGVLKALAVETGAAFLTLAQLNRESEKDKGRPPRLSDLADSGQIERDADTVGLLHRQRGGDKDHLASLIIAKQRDGEVGCVNLHFNGAFCRFENSTTQAPATDEDND